jgi:hypothetical protein
MLGIHMHTLFVVINSVPPSEVVSARFARREALLGPGVGCAKDTTDARVASVSQETAELFS